jgi:hypothetical protein
MRCLMQSRWPGLRELFQAHRSRLLFFRLAVHAGMAPGVALVKARAMTMELVVHAA